MENFNILEPEQATLALFIIQIPYDKNLLKELSEGYKFLGGNFQDFKKWYKNSDNPISEEECLIFWEDLPCKITPIAEQYFLNANDFLNKTDKYNNEKLQEVSKNFRYKGLRGMDIDNQPDIDWLLEGIIPEKGFGVVFGESGSGKSFLIIDLAMAIASGDKTWFGKDIKQANVSYICLEGEGSFKNRLKAWELKNKRQKSDNFVLYNQPFSLLTENDKDINDLADAILYNSGKNGFIIVDTLSRAMIGVDENTSKDMTKIIAACSRLQVLTESAMDLVHHSGKDPTKGMRGSSVLLGASDGIMEVTNSDGYRQWKVYKSKDDVTGEVFPFKLDTHVIGKNRKEKEIKSCTVSSSSILENISQDIKLTDYQKSALEEIIHLLALTEKRYSISKDQKVPCLDKEATILHLANMFKKKDKKNNSSIAKKSVQSLIKKKIIFDDDDFLWRKNY